jgi:Tol biopolymer transport system component
MSTLQPGVKLGRYEIRSLLGAGGMGEVYRARDPELGRDVAIKVLPQAFSADRERLRRFEQEARAAGTLNHPNILAVYDLGSRDGSPYVVTELLEGVTLREELLGGALQQRRALDYARQIAEGLAAAHEKGVVHRDLKPDNLFVTRDGRVKILDFGLAKLTQARTSGSAAAPTAPTITDIPGTEPGLLMGTVGYMSPEQVRGEPADHRADIFSFGVVLYEMLTGRPAFLRDSAVETMSAILKEEPPELSQAGVTIAPMLERVLRRCLEKRPHARFQSAPDLAFALDAMSGASLTVPAAGRPDPGRGKLRRRDVIAGGALLAAGGAITHLAGRFAGFVHGDVARASLPEMQRLTFRGKVVSARFAPEAPTIIYSAMSAMEPLKVFATRPENPESRDLGLSEAKVLAISPSGEIALMVKPTWPGFGQTGTLALMPMSGGAPREILDGVIHADWAPDGSQLAVTRVVSEGARLEFPVGKTLYESPGWLQSPRVSPTGASVAFVEERRAVAMVDVNGRKTVLATEGQTGLWGQLAWSPRGDEVWYAVSEGFVFSPVHAVKGVTTSGRERLVWRGFGLVVMDIARDGRALFAINHESKGISCLPPGASQERDLSWLDYAHVADISTDGTTVLFSERTGPSSRESVYLRKTDGSPAIRLGDGDARTLSPDGKWAIVAPADYDPDHQTRWALLPTGAGDLRPLVYDGIDILDASWFPDGRRLLIAGVEKGRRPRGYVHDLDSGLVRPVTPEGAFPWRVHPDGEAILADDDRGTWLFPLDGGEPRGVAGLEPGEERVQWGAGGSSIYVRQGTGERVQVRRLDLATGRRERWREFAPDPLRGAAFLPLRMTPDGSYYAYTYIRHSADLYLVTGLV